MYVSHSALIYFRYAPGSPSYSMCNITLGRVCTSTKPKELPVLGATGTRQTEKIMP